MNMVHVTIQTVKFEEEISFYEKFAGLTVQRDMRPAADLVFLGENADSTLVEIIREPDASDAGNRYLSVGFHCEDLDAQRKALVQAGFDPTPFISPNPHVRFFFVKDPAGVSVQFI